MEEILDNENKASSAFQFQIYAAAIWLSIVIVAVMFRLMHWPGGSIFLVLGTAGLTAYNLSGLIRTKGKHLFNLILSVLCGIWLIFFLWGAFFNDGLPLNDRAVIIWLIFGGIVFGIQELVFRLSKK